MKLWKSVLGVWCPIVSLLLSLVIVPGCGAVDESFNEVTLDKEEFNFTPEENSILEILGSLVGLSLGDITQFLSLAKVGLGVAETLEKIFVKVFNGTSIDFSFLDRPGIDQQLLSMYEIITLRLEQIKRSTEGTEWNLHHLVRGLPYMVRWEIAMNTLEENMKPINNLHHRFSYYQKHKMDIENHTLLDFADNVVSHATMSIQSLMANIHSIVAPSDPPILAVPRLRTYGRNEYEIDNRVSRQMSLKMRQFLSAHPDKKTSVNEAESKMQSMSLRPGVFQMLKNAIEQYDKCHYEQSPQQLVFGLYTLLALTLARGYTMVNFAYNLLKIHNKGNFATERRFSDELYKHYSFGLLKNAVQTLSRVSNTYGKCDPMEHVEGETFVMLTELLQGYIENEVDMNEKGSCGFECSSYKHGVVKGCYLPDKQYCGKHRRCKGSIHDCRFFDADAWVCLSSKPYRRYDWIEYEDKTKLGEGSKRTCDNVLKIDSWWRFLYHCSYCVCLCDDANSITSDRYISLNAVVSDVAKGMIVTGIRFTKVNRIVQIQVQQGKAMPQGQVDPHTVHWVETEPMSVGTKKFVSNVDYVTLDYTTRNFDLDKLNAPKGHVVTGVKFRMLGTHVNMEVWVTPIDFTSGKLAPPLSFWVSNDNTPLMNPNPRQRVILYDPDDPRKVKSPSVLDSHSDTFVTLQATSLSVDVSQLTVPFFDAQPVSPSPPTWLQGLQVYHRGRPGYGGFIGFRVFSYNLTRHLDEEVEIVISR